MANQSHHAAMIGWPLRASGWVTAVAFGAIGCQTVATDLDQPARLTDANDASRSALQNTVNAALGMEIVLADDALTGTSLLIIERSPQGRIDGAATQGRIMDAPIQFRLVKNGTDCLLIDQRDQSRHLLEKAGCTPE